MDNERHSLLDTIANAFVPIHRDGHKFVFAFALATIVLFLIEGWLGWLGLIATAYCAYFFRDPDRVAPSREGVVVSAADGRIVSIDDVVPPRELGMDEGLRTRISVFLSVFDVHIIRTPVAGRILRSVYVPGAFLNAELDKASEDNERRAMVVQTPEGVSMGVVLIAGLVARRIVTFVGEGDSLAQGERVGLIRFGSRVDVYLPLDAKVLVSVGQTAIGGETVLAEVKPQRAVGGVTSDVPTL